MSPAVSPARSDSSVATDGNEDTASVISWADRCGKFEHQTMAWLGLVWWFCGQRVIIRLYELHGLYDFNFACVGFWFNYNPMRWEVR